MRLDTGARTFECWTSCVDTPSALAAEGADLVFPRKHAFPGHPASRSQTRAHGRGEVKQEVRMLVSLISIRAWARRGQAQQRSRLFKRERLPEHTFNTRGSCFDAQLLFNYQNVFGCTPDLRLHSARRARCICSSLGTYVTNPLRFRVLGANKGQAHCRCTSKRAKHHHDHHTRRRPRRRPRRRRRRRHVCRRLKPAPSPHQTACSLFR